MCITEAEACATPRTPSCADSCANSSRNSTWTVRNEFGMADLINANGKVVLSVNDLAQDALAFVAQTGVFYVRELPGDLTDEEKVALITTLVEYKLLRVGS